MTRPCNRHPLEEAPTLGDATPVHRSAAGRPRRIECRATVAGPRRAASTDSDKL